MSKPAAPYADYAPSEQPPARDHVCTGKAPAPGAVIATVARESPAAELGLEPGDKILAINGREPLDVIDWMWETDAPEVALTVQDGRTGEVVEALLERELGEDVGVTFEDVLFDGIRTCRNACVFCFMSMLPQDMRASLYLRDDDYRLSFLQGNFVTLTNVDDADLARIIERHLSPMNMSVHAITPSVRREMMGRNEGRGIEVAEALMEAGIEIHAQIVLCPGINDGPELDATLAWVEAHPQVTSLAVVPMGYTKHTTRFTSSFSDSVEASRAVVAQVAPYQARAREAYGRTRFYLSDEFYVDAQLPLPPAAQYDDYPQYYDGIGMLRSFLDETARQALDSAATFAQLAAALARKGLKLWILCGYAAQDVYATWCETLVAAGRAAGGIAGSTLDGLAQPYPIENRFFGGDVNVTGLLVAEDILAQLPQDLTGTVVVLPALMFNASGLTLDGMTGAELTAALTARGARALILDTSAEALLPALAEAIS